MELLLFSYGDVMECEAGTSSYFLGLAGAAAKSKS
jgi:hypothetical protein